MDEAHKKIMFRLEVSGSLLLLFVLCFQPLLDCYRTDVYLPEKRKIMLGSGWLCRGFRIFVCLSLRSTNSLFSTQNLVKKTEYTSQQVE